MVKLYQFPADRRKRTPVLKEENADELREGLPACPHCHTSERLDVAVNPQRGPVVFCGCGFSAPHQAWLELGVDLELIEELLSFYKHIDLATVLAEESFVRVSVKQLEDISLKAKMALTLLGIEEFEQCD